jgi:hypothetical protein
MISNSILIHGIYNGTEIYSKRICITWLMKIKKHISTYQHVCKFLDISTNNDFYLYLSDYTCDFPDVKCSNGLKCVNYLHLCDGFNDCDDGSDETLKMCTGKLSIPFFSYWSIYRLCQSTL